MASKFKREFKNVVLNYSDAEAKVREATSNDPWGPSSQVMSELAEYTFHVQAYSLVMGMLWKRLNDSGKNWRHVYKSLAVLEYLIKSGSERVSQQCKENLFSIQTLKDFQYVDKDGKDQGTNIRDKAKQLVALLKDDKKLKEERARARQARERQQALSGQTVNVEFGRSPKSGTKRVQFGSSPGASTSPTTDSAGEGRRLEQNVEQARPSDMSEEEMQLKLALQLSKQQADQEEKLRAQEEESIRAAIALSQVEAEKEEEEAEEKEQDRSGDLLLDLNSSGVVDPWAVPAEPPPSYDAVTASKGGDPWSLFSTTTPSTTNTTPPTQPAPEQDPFAPDPWGGFSSTAPATAVSQPPAVDPWAGFSDAPTTTTAEPPAAVDPWEGLSSAPTTTTAQPAAVDPWSNPLAYPPTSSTSSSLQPLPTTSLNPFDLSDLGPLPPLRISPSASPKPGRIEDQFLGENAVLVDLDSLGPLPPLKPAGFGGPSPANPFGTTSTMTSSYQQNPFDANKPPAPTLNQLVSANQGYNTSDLLPTPLIPVAGGGRTSPVPAQNTQPLPASNQLFNPFS